MILILAGVSVCLVSRSCTTGALAMFVAGLGWLASVRIASAGLRDPRLIVAGAIALRLLAWTSGPRLSDDVYRYVWEGELILAGKSPYAFAPSDPDLAGERARWPALYERVNHKEVSAVYPPITQAAGAVSVLIARPLSIAPEVGGVFVLRVLFGACDLLVLWPLSRLLRREGLPASLSVVWAWCPFLPLEFAGSAHFDSLGVLLLMCALVLATRSMPKAGGQGSTPRRPWIGFGVLSAAVLVKYLPILALPALLRGERWRSSLRRAGLVAAACGLSFVPFLFMSGAERGLFRGLSQYGLRWESTSLVFRWLDQASRSILVRCPDLYDPQWMPRCIAALLWFAAGLRAWMSSRDPIRATGSFIGAFLVLSPALHPWYLAWMLPFVALRSSGAWLWLFAAAPLMYWPLDGWRERGVWVEPVWLWPVIALPFFALLAREAFLDRRGRRLVPSPGPALQ